MKVGDSFEVVLGTVSFERFDPNNPFKEREKFWHEDPRYPGLKYITVKIVDKKE